MTLSGKVRDILEEVFIEEIKGCKGTSPGDNT
jgi:hypothetical protein